jgi:hypothetical protein
MIYDIFYVSKKQIDANNWQQFRRRFPSAQKIENVNSIDDLKKKSFTKFFWLVWDDVVIADDFVFDYRINSWDEDYVHVFKNGDWYDGVSLFSKNTIISKKEFDHRFYINKKEIDITASVPKPFEKFYINTYEEYLETVNNTNSDMFWVIRNDIVLEDSFNFSNYYVPVYDHFHRNITHVFKNGDWYDGVSLFSKNTIISKKEFDHRFPIEKKQHDIVVSNPKSFDIVFISYNESNADKNFKRLTDRFPRAKRIDGVKGIHNAHIEAAKIATTDMVWIVDADAIIIKEFDFEINYIPYYNRNEKDIFLDTVHVWKSLNLVNGLLYGYGGVKLLPRKLLLTMDTNTADMTTSLSKNFKVIPKVSNVTEFNTDAFSTWRSAFRECVKLASKVIDQQYDLETEERLIAWCSRGDDKPFGTYSIAGANAGKKYGEDNINDKEKLLLINNFNWLEEEFLKWQTTNE